MIKALVVIRTSTVQQEVETQKKETIEFAKSYGYTDEEILVIGEAGASAIKLDEAYMSNLNKIYKAIDEYPIECIFAWQLDRVGRDEIVLISLKSKLIEKKIQLRIKNPTLFLFDDNGTINSGMDVAINMFIALARQEMESKKARFKRAKKRNSEEMKFNGGKYVKYGYKVDKQYVAINDDEAANVVEMYKLYATGKYSIKSLTELVNARGLELTRKQVTDILSNTCYKGYTEYSNNMRSHRKYYPIVTEELWNEVEKIRLKNKWDCPKTLRDWLGTKIVKCAKCGHNCVSNRDVYTCVYNFSKNGCDNTVSFSQFNMDKLLLYIALPEHKIYCSSDKKVRIVKLKEELNDVKLRIILKDKSFSDIDERRDRTNKLFIKGKINEAQLDDFFLEFDKEEKKVKDEISQLNKEVINLEQTIEKLASDSNNRQNMFGDLTLKELSQITHEYCKKAIFYRKDPNSKLCIIVEVEYKAYAYNEFEERKRIFEYYPYSKKDKFFENGECIDESMSRILGNLVNVIINTKKK